MKQMLSGLVVLASGTFHLPIVAQEKEAKSPPSRRDFWKRVDKIKAKALVESAVMAAREEVESQRAINTSKRATVLLGAGSEKEYLKQAEAHYQTRTGELRKAKQALVQFVKHVGNSADGRFTTFVRQGGLRELTTAARQSTVQALLNADLSPQDAQSAAKALEDRLSEIQGFSSFHELTTHLERHLDKLIERKMPDEDPDGFCLLILLLSSIYVVMLAIAFIICLYDWAAGQPYRCDGVLSELLSEFCPSKDVETNGPLRPWH